jgi:hypothetical protein
MKTLICITLLSMSLTTFAADPAMKADAQAVDSACTADAQTAGCGSEKVGTGLLKCLHAYKKAHHDFKFSDSCKASMKKMHQDRKAEKAEKGH